jgi:serine/threonine protein kinase
MNDTPPHDPRPADGHGAPAAPAAPAGMGATQVEPASFEANRADALTPGTRLDIYEIERVIGASGFGFVYLAYDPEAQRRVAIKEYLPDTLAVRDEDGMQVLVRADSHIEAFDRGRDAFIEESQLLGRLSHPSLLHVSRSWQSKGTAYRVMPYYPGNSLFMLREAMDSPPDEASLRALLDGLLGALETLHGAGVVHREVSPWNVLLLPDDTPILLDFNAARRAMVGDRARALMSLLTPTFAPIELTNPSAERPVGPWTDLHSLAEVVRYCISGELPKSPGMTGFREPMGALLRRLQGTWPRLQYSASFLTAIDAALQPNPQDRPQSVQELRQRLDDHPTIGAPVRVDESEIDAGVEQELEPQGSLAEEDGGPPTQPGGLADEQPLMDMFRTPASPASGGDGSRAGKAASASAPMAPGKAAPPAAPGKAAPPTSSAPAASSAPATSPSPAPSLPDSPAFGASREWSAPPQRPEPVFGPPPREPEDRTASNQPFYSVLSPSPSSRLSDEPDGYTASESQLFAARAEDRPAIFDFAERNRRARRRWTIVTAVLALVAVAGAAWWIDDERLASAAQSAFEQAVKRDVGVTPPAARPTTPAQPETPAATTPPQDAAVQPLPAPAPAPAASQSSTASPEAPRAVAGTAPGGTQPEVPPLTQQAPPVTSTSGTEGAGAAAPGAAKATTSTAVPMAAVTTAPAATTAASVPPPLSSTPVAPVPAAVKPDFIPPAKAAHPVAKARTPTTPTVSSPRDACGARTDFSLYRCMQTQCAQGRWYQHPSCKRLRERDEVG